MNRRTKFTLTTLLLATVGTMLLAGDFLMPRWLCRGGEWEGPETDHFDGTFFYNPEPGTLYKTSNLLQWLSERHAKGDYPTVKENTHQPQLAPMVDEQVWEVTMVNHSTLLIRTAGLNILTDPIWSDYTSPVQGFGPKRHRPAGIDWEKLPRIDLCLISHDHYDHFDAPTLKRLATEHNPLFIVPLGLAGLLQYHCGADVRVIEADWWESVQHGDLRITLTPAKHWSNRYRKTYTRNRSLWCGFYLKSASGPSIYFVGDSARSDCFTQIHARLGAPDLALIPIGAYKPDWIRNGHISPAEAVEAFRQLHARQAIACHFGTWQLANEGYQETLDDLARALKENNIPAAQFITPDNGQTMRGAK
ncbi:MAG: MBL fold metallo-hydrolase [Akkermansia sp.]|nr:MBL fold metallo-hydrolase [Akkermansia sp.]